MSALRARGISNLGATGRGRDQAIAPLRAEGAALTKRTSSGAIALGQVELDGLDVTDLRALFAAAIDEVWNTSAHDAVMAQEASERTSLREFVERFDTSGVGLWTKNTSRPPPSSPAPPGLGRSRRQASPGAGHQRSPSRAPAIPSDVFGDGTG